MDNLPTRVYRDQTLPIRQILQASMQSFQRMPSPQKVQTCHREATGPTQTRHWKATVRILGNFYWTILYTNLDLKEGGTVSGEGTLPLYPPL